MSLITKKNIQILLDYGGMKVNVNGINYQCKKGIKTEGGYYKNGYTIKKIITKKNTYINLLIYTSAGAGIDIEEQIQLKEVEEGFKCVKHIGWNNLDLKKLVDNMQETHREIDKQINYIKEQKKENRE